MAANEEYSSINNRSWLDKDRLIKLRRAHSRGPSTWRHLSSYVFCTHTEKEHNCYNCSQVITSFVSWSSEWSFVEALWQLIILLIWIFLIFLCFCSSHNSAARSDAVKQVYIFFSFTLWNWIIFVSRVEMRINPRVFLSPCVTNSLELSHSNWPPSHLSLFIQRRCCFCLAFAPLLSVCTWELPSIVAALCCRPLGAELEQFGSSEAFTNRTAMYWCLTSTT